MLPAAAHAQEEVIVTQSSSGTELRGRMVELSATTLAMLVDGKRVEVPLDRVLRIEGRNDSVKDGAAIGAAVGGGLTALSCGSALGRSGICVSAAIFYAGLGALAGAGVDALHKGRTTIYSKPPAMSLAVTPAPKGARAQLRIRW